MLVREKERARAETAPEGRADERHVLKFMKRPVETTKSFFGWDQFSANCGWLASRKSVDLEDLFMNKPSLLAYEDLETGGSFCFSSDMMILEQGSSKPPKLE